MISIPNQIILFSGVSNVDRKLLLVTDENFDKGVIKL